MSKRATAPAKTKSATGVRKGDAKAKAAAAAPAPAFWWQEDGNIDAVKEIARRKADKRLKTESNGKKLDIAQGEITKVGLSEYTSAKAVGAVETFLDKELYGRRKRTRDMGDRNDRKIGGHRKK